MKTTTEEQAMRIRRSVETLIDPSFPKPTVELVLEAEKRFDLDDEVTERALTELV
jgi:hypothetical protein